MSPRHTSWCFQAQYTCLNEGILSQGVSSLCVCPALVSVCHSPVVGPPGVWADWLCWSHWPLPHPSCMSALQWSWQNKNQMCTARRVIVSPLLRCFCPQCCILWSKRSVNGFIEWWGTEQCSLLCGEIRDRHRPDTVSQSQLLWTFFLFVCFLVKRVQCHALSYC